MALESARVTLNVISLISVASWSSEDPKTIEGEKVDES